MAARTDYVKGMIYLPAYCELISSPAQLEVCKRAPSLNALLATIKEFWHAHGLSDNELLAILSGLNQTVLSETRLNLAGEWLPCQYDGKTRSISWCLPVGQATEPFFDEYIFRCRHSVLINQILAPKTSLTTLQHQEGIFSEIKPKGFIFHLSRCGSTLISGALSELDSTCVFSESPVLTEIMLDTGHSHDEKKEYLRKLIDLQASAFAPRADVIIKWNAWDILSWQLIRDVYPDVPAILLIRNPVEIIASHHRSSGRHMGGDPTIEKCHPELALQASSEDGLLAFRIHVLRTLLQATAAVRQGGRVVDYNSQLDLDCLEVLCSDFALSVAAHERHKMAERMRFHSKTPGLAFKADSVQKRSVFSSAQQDAIDKALLPIYTALIKDIVPVAR